MSKKIVLWCGTGANQKALAVKVHQRFGLSGIVLEERKTVHKTTSYLHKLKRYWNAFRFRRIHLGWLGMQHYYNRLFPSMPDVPLLKVENINTGEVEQFSRDLQADLIMVSGTSLVKEPLLSIPLSVGIINLHTGLSPYVKGGPNCTNWCIANNHWHLIGNTIMWINAGIDSGNLITTETVDIQQTKNLKEAHIRVMEHAHDLYLRAIGYLLKTESPFISVPQAEIDKGQLFLTKMWTDEKKQELLINWKQRRNVRKSSFSPKTVSLPSEY